MIRLSRLLVLYALIVAACQSGGQSKERGLELAFLRYVVALPVDSLFSLTGNAVVSGCNSVRILPTIGEEHYFNYPNKDTWPRFGEFPALSDVSSSLDEKIQIGRKLETEMELGKS